jgi:ComF family protein
MTNVTKNSAVNLLLFPLIPINNLSNRFMNYLDDFIGLIYPNICLGCGNTLWRNEKFLCTFCDFRLPRTNFHLERENQFSRLFYGRVITEETSAYLYFNKGNTAQKLVHALKYKGMKEVGVWLGMQYGQLLKSAFCFSTVDHLVPVPLHPKKFQDRGFNQSDQIALGLSSALHIPVENNLLVRTRRSDTQTKKRRFLRWQNVEDIFSLQNITPFEGKHVLLVDDVVTTGATLESCAIALSAIKGIRISMAALAIATL